MQHGPESQRLSAQTPMSPRLATKNENAPGDSPPRPRRGAIFITVGGRSVSQWLAASVQFVRPVAPALSLPNKSSRSV